MTNAIVEVRNLRKTYGPKVAVQDVSFDVHAGEIFGILGPNGAGKTTTVECIAGLRKADGGHVSVLGLDPQTHPLAVREHLGIQFQEAQHHDKITVEEALRLCDRLVLIDHGEVVAAGTPADLIRAVDGATSLEDVFIELTVARTALEGAFL